VTSRLGMGKTKAFFTVCPLPNGFPPPIFSCLLPHFFILSLSFLCFNFYLPYRPCPLFLFPMSPLFSSFLPLPSLSVCLSASFYISSPFHFFPTSSPCPIFCPASFPLPSIYFCLSSCLLPPSTHLPLSAFFLLFFLHVPSSVLPPSPAISYDPLFLLSRVSSFHLPLSAFFLSFWVLYGTAQISRRAKRKVKTSQLCNSIGAAGMGPPSDALQDHQLPPSGPVVEGAYL
jgi:hypothetical protein